MWSPPSRCESTAGIPAHQNPFAVLLNIPDAVACTCIASQPSEISPLEVDSREVAGILRTFRLFSLISNVKRVLLHFARTHIVQVNAYRTRAITQSVSRNPRSF